jgi:hypothetical protein
LGIEKLKAVEQIWPVVLEVNGLAPGFARVRKENIVFVEPERLMERGPKGTVQRRPTVRLYGEELAALYGGPPALEAKKYEVVMNGHVRGKGEPILNRCAENGKASVGQRGERIGFFLK